MDLVPGPLLQTIDSPENLKKLSREELQTLTDELRQYIIDVVSLHGGHFAASLGVVELTVALHHVFNTPYDQLVWDVGHKSSSFRPNRSYSIKKALIANSLPHVSCVASAKRIKWGLISGMVCYLPPTQEAWLNWRNLEIIQ